MSKYQTFIPRARRLRNFIFASLPRQTMTKDTRTAVYILLLSFLSLSATPALGVGSDVSYGFKSNLLSTCDRSGDRHLLFFEI